MKMILRITLFPILLPLALIGGTFHYLVWAFDPRYDHDAAVDVTTKWAKDLLH